MGIRKKLVLCLLAVLVPILAVSLFATHLLDRQLRERTATALANAQRLEAARINEVLSAYALDARRLAAGAHLKEFLEKTNAYRQALKNNPHLAGAESEKPLIGGYDNFPIIDPGASWPLQHLALELQRKAGIIGSAIVDLRLVDRDGKTLGESIGFGWHPTDEKLVNRSMRTVRTYFGNAFRNEKDQDRLGIVSPVISLSGKVVGAILMESRLRPITDLMSMHEGVGYSSEAHIAQATPDGSAQFITPLRFDRAAAFGHLVPEAANKPVNMALQSEKSQVVTALDYRGMESILAIQKIPQTGWGLVVKIDSAEAYEPVQKLRNWLKFATLASIVFVLLIYLFCLMPIARRLKKTAAAAKQITNGHLTTKIADNSNDEISDVASTINSLARDLEQDQKKRGEVEAQLLHQALHDDLTGILNRKHANKVINQLNAEYGKSHSVLFLDLNGFKDVNDLYGHAAGDEVLKTVARRLSAEIPEGGTLARWGGDEFVVILPNTDEKQATEFGVILHNVFDTSIQSAEGTHTISCSVGLASSSHKRSLDDALIAADALMYEQKKQQRFNRSKGGMAARGVERALNEDRMEVWYQPMLRIQRPGNYELIGAGTHIRIRSNNGGYVLADEFMQDIQGQSLCIEMDNRLFRLSLQALHRWKTAGMVDDSFALSIKPTELTLNDPVFPTLLQNQLQAASIDASQIVLELPSLMKSVRPETIKLLDDMNVRLAMDGISIEPDVLKQLNAVNPAMAMLGKPWLDDEIVLPHLVSICQQKNVSVLARNIETREQLGVLHDLGVTHFQGRLFEQPVRAVDFVSRWGQTRLTGLGISLTKSIGMRLAG